MTELRRLRQWKLVVQPGETVDVVPSSWADTLVVVISGELEVQCCSGQRARFAAGAVLTLAGLPGSVLCNPRPQPLVLHAVTRHEPNR